MIKETTDIPKGKDPVFVAKTLTKPIIEKLEVEGRELNILPQLTSSKLPI